MAIRVVSKGTTVVKKITVGVPNKIGIPSQGLLTRLDDVNSNINLSDNSYLRYSEEVSKFLHRPFDSDVRSSARGGIFGGAGITYDSSTGFVSVTNTGVDSGLYGSATLVPSITVNSRGQIDSIGTVAVAGVSSFTFDSSSHTLNIGTADGGSFNARVIEVDSDYITLRRPPETIFTVTTADGGNYRFTGDGFPTESGNNPDIYLTRGKEYVINNPSSGNHPLEIRVSDGGSEYTTGITGNGTSLVRFKVPFDAPDTLVYQCQVHAGMIGNIYINEIKSNNTDDLTEGSTNLYFTDDRVDTALASVNGHIVPQTHLTHDLGDSALRWRDLYLGGSTIYLGGLQVKDLNGQFAVQDSFGNGAPINFAGSLTVGGDLTVQGTTTTINSTTLSVNDKNIVLADSATDSNAANGAGITVNGANALITYNATTDTWDLNKPLGSIRNHLVNFSTDNLSEGSTNLYYTKARHDSDFETEFAAKNSGQLTEGSNLYYTTARVDSAILDGIITKRIDFRDSDNGSVISSTVGFFDPTTQIHTMLSTSNDSNSGYAFQSQKFLITNLANDYYLRTYDSGQIGLFFSGNSKLETNNSGVSITGLLSADTVSGRYLGFDSDVTRSHTVSRIRNMFDATGDLSYDSSTGVFSFDVEQVYTKVNFDSDFNQSLDEAAIGGVGLAYNSTTNALRIDSAELAAFAAPIRSYFSAAGDLSYNNTTGEFTFDVEQVYTKANFDSDFNDALDQASLAGTGISFAADSNTLSITDTGVTAGSYGSASLVPVLSINAQGQITTASTVSVAGVSSTSFDSANGIFTINTADGGSFATTILDSDFTASRARDVVRAVDAGGDGSFVYDSASGTFTYTGPSATEARAHFSGGNGINITSGKIDMDSAYNAVFNNITNTSGEIFTTPTEVSVNDNNATVVDTEAHDSDFKSIEYVVHMDDNAAGHSQLSKVLLTYNKSSVFFTEYGMVSSFTGDSDIGTLTADVSGSDIRLIFTRSSGMGTISVKPVKTVIS